MARPRQPVSLLQAKGKKHLTKAEIEERKSQELKVNSDNVKAPVFLNESLIDEFNKFVQEMNRFEILDNTDSDAVGRYTYYKNEFARIAKKLSKTGPDNKKYDDYLKKLSNISKEINILEVRFGITPGNRCKLVIPTQKEDKPPNKFSKFMK
ncbi:phage terminase small subunit P27 family [Paraclostridium sordellii]|uniref:phage terminase small subunit P27 family n=1 Tax=Paraclostridium sordellii TaxID=1505 RepID=UPI0005E828BF|nr:phage terminase small subunit P27 family [Paeniclostridium sordellii]CEO07630.1 phage terminase small subunit [[Clostridium] sordellii] [Paeniclostridium sordellii]